MKKILLNMMIIAGFCAVAVSYASRDDFKKRFMNYANLRSVVVEGEMYSVRMGSEVLEKCSAGVRDLRLIDTAGREVSYVIIGQREIPGSVERVNFKVTGYTYDKKRAEISMELPEKHGEINSIYMNIGDKDFSRDVKLYGSSDKSKWELIVEDIIYDFSSQVDLRKTSTEFEKTAYRYYKVELEIHDSKGGKSTHVIVRPKGLGFSITETEDKKLKFYGISGRMIFEKRGQAIYDEKTFVDLNVEEDVDKNTAIVLEASLPFEKLIFSVTNKYYYRKVNIFGSDSGEKDEYQLLARDAVYSFPLSDKMEVKNSVLLKSRKYKYYKFVIINKDNPPLDVKAVTFKWVRKSLFFVALSDGVYSLFFGNPYAVKPEYDLSKFIHQGNWYKQEYVEVNLGGIEKSAAYVPKLLKDKKFMGVEVEKWILYIIVAFMIVGIGYYLYVLVKKASEGK